MRPVPRSFRRRAQQGVALVEALTAVLVLGIGLVGAVAMQARSYQALADAGSRAEATIAIERLVGIMNAYQVDLSDFAVEAGAAAPARLEDWYADTTAAVPGAVVEISVTPVANTTRTVVTVALAWQRRGTPRPGSVACTTSGALPAACDRQVETFYITQSA